MLPEMENRSVIVILNRKAVKNLPPINHRYAAGDRKGRPYEHIRCGCAIGVIHESLENGAS